MESSEFVTYFEKVPFLMKHFLGVFPIDQLPKRLKKKTFFVCNLDPSTMPGSHWICFIKLVSTECEIFDSFGVNMTYILPFIKFNQKTHFVYNTNSVQDKTSLLCGKFVVMFIIERFLNQTMEFCDLIDEIFTENKIQNDDIVTKFCDDL